ncbi:hypothetical protein [Rheinheimera aquimaris]|uniref:hypothetical protein n=1 Tax=Rheinheimera aquimaris TaxID=412437 RepID=UPI003A96E63E|tara:strand:+ start:1452 stop:1913 length:462 start_codon:yes stop_codon:yes gene_type:complete
MNEKISKALIIAGMIVIAFPITLLIIIADISMITSLSSEFSEVSNVAGSVIFLSILSICSIAMFSYFYLAINFIRKGRSDSGKQQGFHFYVVLTACLIVLFSYLLGKILPELPTTVFEFGVPMILISLHVLLEHGLVNLLTNKGKATRTARLL